MPKPDTNAIDQLIGANLRHYRLRRGMTQQALSAAIGKSAHQIQKYENAKNRLAVSTLLAISKVLNSDGALLDGAIYTKGGY